MFQYKEVFHFIVVGQNENYVSISISKLYKIYSRLTEFIVWGQSQQDLNLILVIICM